MAKITLASLKADIEKKYAPFQIENEKGEVATFLNPMRMSKAQRKKVSDYSEVLTKVDQSDEDAMVEVLEGFLTNVAETPHDAQVAIDACEHDVVVLSELVAAYNEDQDAGEASPSQS